MIPGKREKVVGYNIYRAEELNCEYARINANLALQPRYVDQTATRAAGLVRTEWSARARSRPARGLARGRRRHRPSRDND